MYSALFGEDLLLFSLHNIYIQDALDKSWWPKQKGCLVQSIANEHDSVLILAQSFPIPP